MWTTCTFQSVVANKSHTLQLFMAVWIFQTWCRFTGTSGTCQWFRFRTLSACPCLGRTGKALSTMVYLEILFLVAVETAGSSHFSAAPLRKRASTRQLRLPNGPGCP